MFGGRENFWTQTDNAAVPVKFKCCATTTSSIGPTLMRNRPLGRTGLFVSELCLGTMTFGGGEGIWSQIGDLQQSDAERLVGQALDAGINFIDTADMYAGGRSEQITGQALKNLKVPRENVIIASKVFGEVGSGPNARGASRAHILDGIKA